MKIAVVGAGSTYTPEFVSGLSRDRERLPVEELALHDIDLERLSVVGGLARRMLSRQGFEGSLVETDDLSRALEGADAVLIQIRVGGQAARLLDETVPLECGCIGQETTGAGGFAKALRTVPVVLAIAERAREVAPDAWVVDFTNPVGIVTRALLDDGHRAVGLCNVNINVQRTAAQLLGVSPERVLADQVGLNHLSWVRAVWLDGEDMLPGLLAEHADRLAAEAGGVPVRLLEELGAVPSYYLRYFYEHDRVLEEQRDGIPRAAEVAEIEEGLLELYRDPELTEKPALLERRGGAFYSEAALGLLGALFSDGSETHVVDLRNDGAVPGLADDDVVEIPARVGGGRVEPLPQKPLAPELLGLVQHVTAYERLAIEAARTGDPVVARKALLAHPLVGQFELAEELVERLLSAGAEHLPRFGTVRPT